MSKFIIINILNSLNNHVKSFSLRKEIAALYALLGILLDIVFFIKVKDPYYLLLGLVVNFCFILLILGIITLEQITNLKNGFLSKEHSLNEDINQINTETTSKEEISEKTNTDEDTKIKEDI